jgi:hypothetical protein
MKRAVLLSALSPWILRLMLTVLGAGMMVPALQAQPVCSSEFNLARGALRAAALPRRLSRDIDRELLHSWDGQQLVRASSSDRLGRRLAQTRQLLAVEGSSAVSGDIPARVEAAVQVYQDCLKAAPVPRQASLRVIVSRYTTGGGTAIVSGARVRIGNQLAGLTGSDGSLMVRVSAGRPLQVAADDTAGFAGAAEVAALAAGGSQDVMLAMGEKTLAETNDLVLDEIDADGLLPTDFAGLTLRFLDDGVAAPVAALGSVMVENEKGSMMSLGAMFTVNARGEIVAAKTENIRQALLGSSGPLTMDVLAYDRAGYRFHSAARFEVGRNRFSGRLVPSPAMPAAALGRTVVTLTSPKGAIYRALSDESGHFHFDHLPNDILRLEAGITAGAVEYKAADSFALEGDRDDSTFPLRRDGEQVPLRVPAKSVMLDMGRHVPGRGPHNVQTDDIEYSVTDVSTNKCARDDSETPPRCRYAAQMSEWFEIPQGTSSVLVEYEVWSEETRERVASAHSRNRDYFALFVTDRDGGLFNYRENDTFTYYWYYGLPLPGSKWYTDTLDTSLQTRFGPWSVRLGAAAYNCCSGDETLQTKITVRLVITGSCPIPPSPGTGTEEVCPPAVSVSNLTSDGGPVSPYGDTTPNNDGSVYSIPRQNQFNHYPRRFLATIHKTPDDAVLTGDLTLYDATTDQLLSTIRVFNPLTPISGFTDLYTLPVSFDSPNVSSQLGGVPPPFHFLRYRFHVHAEKNEQVADKVIVSDPMPVRQRALWRMPDIFNSRRFGGGHTNGGDGEAGGDNWTSRGTYDWMSRNAILLTRINDISGEHGAELGHSGHGYGTDIDIYHFWPATTATDPIGGDVYQTLKSDALVAQNIENPEPSLRQAAAASIARLGQWVSASRTGIDLLLALPEVQQVGYIIDGGEWGGRRRGASHGGGAPPAPTGLLPGWGRDLLRSGRIVYGNGVVADTALGTWTNGGNIKMNYWVDHHTHVHITLDRCTVDADTCAPIPTTHDCEQPAVTASPESTTITAGQNTTLSISVSGDGPFSYQWFASPLNSNDETAVPDSNGPSITVSPNETTIYRAEVTNGCGDDQSVPAVVTVHPQCPLPAATVAITASAVSISSTMTPTLTAVGSSPQLSYTWYRGTPPDTNAFEGVGTVISPQVTAPFASFWVRAIDACDTQIDAGPVTISVCVPTIVQQPAGMTIAPGQQAVVSVGAQSSNSTPLVYQWYAGAAGNTLNPLAGETGSELHVQPSVTTQYWATVRGTCFDGSTATPAIVASAGALVHVCAPPVIQSITAGREAHQGEMVNLQVDATGSDLAFQWFRGNSGDTSAPIAGAISSSYSFVAATASAGSYWVRVTSEGLCPANSTASAFTVCVPPVITQQPSAAASIIMPGATTTLTAAATGSALTYQWFLGEVADRTHPLAGGTSSILATPSLTQMSVFWLEVSSGGCPTASNSVTVAVCTPPTVQWQGGAPQIAPGADTILSVDALPLANTMLSWYQGTSGNVAGSTLIEGPTVNRSRHVAPTATASYWVRIVAENGCYADSATRTVTVCVPTITSQPAGGMINNGQTLTLIVGSTLSGSTYQWYRGTVGDVSNPIAGATAASYSAAPAVTTSYWVRVTGTCGSSVNSATVTVTVCVPPTIGTQPAGASVTRGQSVNLAVTASGTNLTYQWYQGAGTGSPYGGATSSTLSVTPQSTATYWCRVSGSCGSADSATAQINVCAAPAISAQPQSRTILSGQTATLSVTVTADALNPAVHYHWYRGTVGDRTTTVGTDANTFTTPALTATTSYWVALNAGACETVSQQATISMCALPSVAATGPTSIHKGDTITVSLGPNPGTSGITYQWYAGPSGNTASSITSATAYAVTVQPQVTTSYWCRVTNATCSVDSSAVTASVCIPRITTQPAGSMVNSGQSWTMSVATDVGASTVQWYRGNPGDLSNPVAGATAASLTVSPTSTTTYFARVTGSCSQWVDSGAATVSVCIPPAITGNPSGASITRGQSVNLTVTATGTGLTYQWYQGAGTGSPYGGATSATLTANPQVPTAYWCRVTGSCGTANSASAQIDVCATPVISAQPLSQTIADGGTATLGVTASEPTGLALHYQWYRSTSGNPANPVGTDAPTYTTAAISTQTSYFVRITSGACSLDSATAVISTCPLPIMQTIGGGNFPRYQTILLRVSPAPSDATFAFYEGPVGDTSNFVGGGGIQSTLYISASHNAQYWARVDNGTCHVDTTATAVTVY